MSWLTKLRNTLHPSRLEGDLADEIRDHLARRTAELQRSGLTDAEARRQAEVIFGNRTATLERSRDLRLWGTIDATVQDVRYAWRGLLRNPVFALTAVVSLGLAIGANTAIYAIVDAVMLRPLPVPQPERLIRFATSSDGEAFSYPMFEQLRAASKEMARVVLFDSPNRVEARLGGSEAASYEEVTQQFVSPDMFEALEVPPALGRLLSSREDRYPSPRAVAVLSYEYWQRRFGADPAVLGQRLNVGGRAVSILGVARSGFSGVEPGKVVDVWLPITLADPDIFSNAEYRPFRLMGRLAAGANAEQLGARLQPVFHHQMDSRVSSGMPPVLQKQVREATLVIRSAGTGISEFRKTFSRPLGILFGVAICILLIACANVASLLLARSSARSGEMALRVSLGAGRSRLVRQLLTESLLISLLAGFCGWVLANLAAPALVAMMSMRGDPIQLDLAPDSHVLLFCAAICALAAVFFGGLPAWQATASGPMFGVRRVSGQVSRLRLGRLFVGVQVAFAFCLVASGAGFLFSLHNLDAVDTGFDPAGVTVLTIVNSAQARDHQLAFLQQMQLRAAMMPGVESAAAGWMAVFSGARRAQRIALPGKTLAEREETFYRVSPGYFATLRTPLIAGRDFTFRDNDNEPVPTIVNRAFAIRYFGDNAAIGREFVRDDGVRHQVVGLAANSHFGDLRNGPEAIAYFPMKPPGAFTLYVRSKLDAGSVAKMMEREAHSLAPGARVRDVTTLEALVGNSLVKERLLASIGGIFAVLGLVLATVGLFGLLNYAVARRTKEIGIRAALGAERSSIYGLVLSELMGPIAGGWVAGLAGSLAILRWARSLLFGVAPADPVVIGTAIAVFLVAALVAAGAPVRRAAAIDPMVALRHE